MRETIGQPIAARKQLNLFLRPEDREEESWDFTGEETTYLTHGLHPYLVAMIPQIPRRLMAKYAGPRMKILDPFVGGGTVLVEAYLANLPSTGIDINPLSVIISKAKTTPIPRHILLAILEKFDRTYQKARPDMPVFPDSARMDFWFKPYMFEPLARIGAAIKQLVAETKSEHRGKIWNLLACVFSDTVRDVSLTYRGEIRLRRLNGKDLETFNPDVFAEYKKRISRAFALVGELPAENRLPVIHNSDCRQIEAPAGYFDLVITSPPYGDNKNTIPYHQFSKNMLYWLGIGEEALNLIREGSLGSRNSTNAVPVNRGLHRALNQMKKPNLKREAVAFYADYAEALREIARVTSGRIIITIGHRILEGIVFDNPQITTEIMSEIGWTLETVFQRSIRKKRLHRKMGVGHNAQGATIDRESILVYVPAN